MERTAAIIIMMRTKIATHTRILSFPFGKHFGGEMRCLLLFFSFLPKRAIHKRRGKYFLNGA